MNYFSEISDEEILAADISGATEQDYFAEMDDEIFEQIEEPKKIDKNGIPLKPQYKDDTIFLTLYERIDVEKLKKLNANLDFYMAKVAEHRGERDHYDPVWRKTLHTGVSQMIRICEENKTNKYEVTYKRKGKGRFFASHIQSEMSLQGLTREFRACIGADYFDDIDIENCHPNILWMLGQEELLDLDAVKYYCENREEMLMKLMVCNRSRKLKRAKAKQYILALMNGGLRWKGYNHPPELDAFIADVEKMFFLYKEKYPDRYKKAEKIVKQKLKQNERDGNKWKNPSIYGTMLNVKFCERESQILGVIFEYFQKIGVVTNEAVLCHDGVMVPKGKITKKILEDCEEYIAEIFGYYFRLTKKPMHDIFSDIIKDQPVPETKKEKPKKDPVIFQYKKRPEKIHTNTEMKVSDALYAMIMEMTGPKK